MPRGRKPLKQLAILAGILQQGGLLYHKGNVEEPLLNKLLEKGLVTENVDGFLNATATGITMIREESKSAMFLVDYDNVEHQAREHGFQQSPEDHTAFLRRQALSRNILFDGAAKFCFLTTKSGGTEAMAEQLAASFLKLGYYVNMVQPAPDAADMKMKEIARCAMLNPSVNTVFLVSHDTGFVSTIEALLKRKKKVVPIMVNWPSPKIGHIASRVVQIQPSWEEEQRFKRKVEKVLLSNEMQSTDGESELVVLAALVAGVSAQECSSQQLPFHALIRKVASGIEEIKKKINWDSNGFGTWHYRMMVQVLIEQDIIKQVRVYRIDNGRKIPDSKHYVFKGKFYLSKILLGKFITLTGITAETPTERKEADYARTEEVVATGYQN